MAWFVVHFVCVLRRKQVLGKKPLAEEMQRLSSSELFTAPTKEHGVLTTWNLGSEPGQGWRLSQCWGI